MDLTPSMLQHLKEMLDSKDMFEDDLNEDNSFILEYTGRGMHNTNCFGMVVHRAHVDQASLVTFFMATMLNGQHEVSLADLDLAEVIETMRELDIHRKTDDMGKGKSIMYWPNYVRYVDDSEEEEAS